jgi:hypothetical protein
MKFEFEVRSACLEAKRIEAAAETPPPGPAALRYKGARCKCEATVLPVKMDFFGVKAVLMVVGS